MLKPLKRFWTKLTCDCDEAVVTKETKFMLHFFCPKCGSRFKIFKDLN